ncbi:Na(+)/H(+) antiporter subunit E [Hartmannibacter diazotrophicus]|uniref:Na(+)/H(+) antiporter subunit E n=1 Tax=Hartmannibacter diazotrophicus TaxID=1482074 RepID=A0A2C9D3F1_9HYPH|nr:Na+/H+ antiporter subunit E [Hartmannibacter diazotrophicus]SON54857.1 Na(+)/H(+) antiporter subunit E [Hartmannibacter diazotrophicus]
MNALYLVNLLFALLWAAITNSYTLPNIIFGFLLGLLALSLVRHPVGTVRYFSRGRKIVELVLLFFWELVLSGIRVMRVVIKPDMKLNPGFIAFPLTVTRDFEITLLANLITLTPGTLSVDVSEDRRFIYVHCIDVPDPDAVVADIRSGFEAKIIEAFQ